MKCFSVLIFYFNFHNLQYLLDIYINIITMLLNFLLLFSVSFNFKSSFINNMWLEFFCDISFIFLDSNLLTHSILYFYILLEFFFLVCFFVIQNMLSIYFFISWLEWWNSSFSTFLKKTFILISYITLRPQFLLSLLFLVQMCPLPQIHSTSISIQKGAGLPGIFTNIA